MKSTKLLRATAVAVLGLSLGATVVSAAPGTGTIGTTGPNSHNEVTFNGGSHVNVDNNNMVRVGNYTDQHAYTGDAVTANNTTGGDAATGSASNDTMLSAHLSVNNAGSSAAALAASDNGMSSGTITNTGPSSFNEITFQGGTSVSVDNNNCISVENNVDQHASSGDATVTNNTTGGSATTGDAANSSSTDVTISVTN